MSFCTCRKPGRENLCRCTYVLPDGVTHTKGFVKYPDQVHRYRTLADDAPLVPTETKEDMNNTEMTERPEDRRRVDLTKNVVLILLLEVQYSFMSTDFNFFNYFVSFRSLT